MLVQHSREILMHRLALSQSDSLSANQALIAKEQGAMLNAEAIARLDSLEPAPEAPARPNTHLVDKSV